MAFINALSGQNTDLLIVRAGAVHSFDWAVKG